jgi:hypothetical protein
MDVRRRYTGRSTEDVLAMSRVEDLKIDLRALGWPLAGCKADLANRLRRFANRPLEVQQPRGTERYLLVWDHPLTGRRVLYAVARGAAMADRMRGHMQADWRSTWLDAVKHLPDLEEPSLRIVSESSGIPEASEREQRGEELLREIARLERGSMVPILSGDFPSLARLSSQIERMVEQWRTLLATEEPDLP